MLTWADKGIAGSVTYGWLCRAIKFKASRADLWLAAKFEVDHVHCDNNNSSPADLQVLCASCNNLRPQRGCGCQDELPNGCKLIDSCKRCCSLYRHTRRCLGLLWPPECHFLRLRPSGPQVTANKTGISACTLLHQVAFS